jgi:hypothetical protein
VDAIAPSAEAETRRRDVLRQVIAGRIGPDLTAILMDEAKLPGQVEALERLIQSTASGFSPPKPARPVWQDMDPLSKIGMAHRHQATHDAKLAGKKG